MLRRLTRFTDSCSLQGAFPHGGCQQNRVPTLCLGFFKQLVDGPLVFARNTADLPAKPRGLEQPCQWLHSFVGVGGTLQYCRQTAADTQAV